MIRAGRPWCDGPHARRDEILELRRLARASADSPATWPTLAEFYAGRGVLLTGGSGFMGRVLVEFLLRCCPDIGNIFLVLRSRKGVSPEKRIHQLTDVALFDKLRREQPDALSKLVAVAGDAALPGLGLSDEDRERLTREVSVVFHCAASVRFDDPFQKAVFTNLRSTRDIIRLAREMPGLKALVHVSTAYSFINQPVIEERVFPTHLDWRDVIRWAEELSEGDVRCVDWLGSKVRDFQPNTYTFTKALAERLVEDEAADLPTIIARPSIVINSHRDPIPGWVDNLNGPMGLWLAGCKGILRSWPHGNAVMDTIPVDVATKMILLASWMKGIGKPLRTHVECGVDVVNATVGGDLGPNSSEYEASLGDRVISKVPCMGAVRPPRLRGFSGMHDWRHKVLVLYEHLIFGVVLDMLARAVGQKPRAIAVYRVLHSAFQALRPFTECYFDFEAENQKILQSHIHPLEDANFDFTDLYKIRDSVEIFEDLVRSTLRGIFVYVMHEEEKIEESRRNMKRVRWFNYLFHVCMFTFFCGIMYVLLRLRKSPIGDTVL